MREGNLHPRRLRLRGGGGGGKHAKVAQTKSFSEGAIMTRRSDQQIEVPAWVRLDGAPLQSDAFIRDF